MSPATVDPVGLDQLPSLPAAAARIVVLCDDPEVGLAELGTAVSLDPALSARLLRVANSAAYNRGQPINTLDRAMMQLGLKAVKITALGFVVSSSLSDALGEHGDDLVHQVWQRCLVEAVACRELAGAAGLRLASEAFLIGLFDGLGPLLGLIARPEAFGALLAESAWLTDDGARAALGVTLPELVSAALESWDVPSLYRDAMCRASQNVEATSGSEVDLLASVLLLARDASCQLLGQPSTNVELSAELAATLGIPPGCVEAIAADLTTNVEQLAATLNVNLGETPDFVSLLSQARAQMMEVSMAVACESQERSAELNRLKAESEALQHEARTDKLTGLGNRAAFDDALATAVADRATGATRSGYLGLLIFDIDHFKGLNDTHGHQCGDRVLSEIGQLLGALTRDRETTCRYGGEEFALIAPIVDDAGALLAIAERIRTAIEAHEIVYEGIQIAVTVSVGGIGARHVIDERATTTMIEAADRLLYQAKHSGRNRSYVTIL